MSRGIFHGPTPVDKVPVQTEGAGCRLFPVLEQDHNRHIHAHEKSLFQF
jgi:hypothetical protein